MENKIRIKDIARLAQVSIGTVDRVIHNRGEVSEKTREKIEQIIKELNYEPDILASTLASKRNVKFAALIPEINRESSFWKPIVKGLHKAFNEINHFGVNLDILSFDQFNREDYHQKIEQIIERSPDAIVFAPVFYDEALYLTNKCKENNISYVLINSTLDEDGKLGFVGQDSIQSGYVAAKLLTYGLNQPSKIVTVSISKSLENHKHIQKRKHGFEQYIKDFQFNNCQLINLDIGDTSEEIVNSNLDQVFSKNEDINAIFVTNSKVFKVASWLSESNKKGIRLIGYDLIDENIPFLNDGIIDFLISQNPVEQGYSGIMTLFNYLVLKREVKKEYLLPIDIITKENIMYFINN